MFASTSNSSRPLAALLLLAPLFLAHCSSGSDTWTDPDHATPAATLDVAQPLDATGHTPENPVGQPVSVQITLTQTAPVTCQSEPSFLGCGAVGDSTEGPCTTCSGPNKPLDFTITAIGCDDDLCDVVSVEHGDASTGDTVTIVPKAGLVTVRATATGDGLTSSASVQVFANCVNAPSAPNCP
jgi:hypothetical protein